MNDQRAKFQVGWVARPTLRRKEGWEGHAL